jgi:hypothetical protein
MDIESEEKLREEIVHLKSIHTANFASGLLPPLKLLNQIHAMKLQNLFPNVCIALRIFLTLPVTVASAERSFSKLKLIKNYLRNSMVQERLVDLTILSIESDLNQEIDFSDIIDTFAAAKSRKAPL